MIWMALAACFGGEERWEPTTPAFAGEREGRGGYEAEESEESESEEVQDGPHQGRADVYMGRSVREGLRSSVPPVTDATWKEECGSCHMAYSPGLLPRRSWKLLLGDLAHHFGDDATVDAATLEKLDAFAFANAADVAPYRLSAALARASEGTTPTRILDIGWLKHEHGEVPKDWVTGNAEVKSLSNCAACHQGAAEGRFSEGEILIPGHGRFDD